MKKKITVEANQTLWDIALQEYGSAESVFTVITDNELSSVNANLTPGQLLIIDTAKIKVKPIVDFYLREKIKPASGFVPVIPGGAFNAGAFSVAFDIT